MNQPNQPCAPLDLGDHVQYSANAPFWILAAFGHSNFKRAQLLCPVCGSVRLRPLENAPASIFTANRHYEARLWEDRVEEAFDSGKMGNVLSFMIDLACDNGHECELDLHFSMDRPEDGITFSVLLPEAAYKQRHPQEFKKWGPRCEVTP